MRIPARCFVISVCIQTQVPCLVLSLGCENNQPDDFMKMLGNYDHDRIKLLVTQKVEGDELEEGMKDSAQPLCPG